MQLLVSTLKKEISTLQDNNVKLTTIGQTDNLPSSCQRELHEAMEMTRNNTGLILVLALSYSGRWEIVEATRRISADVEAGIIESEEIDASIFARYLTTFGIPDPELLVRTSGEMRISNFLLWQIAYSEIYITDKLWPDFRKKDLYEAIVAYQKRERRFGRISEQAKT
jgi:undecaprenyl diphosphate synthase